MRHGALLTLLTVLVLHGSGAIPAPVRASWGDATLSPYDSVGRQVARGDALGNVAGYGPYNGSAIKVQPDHLFWVDRALTLKGQGWLKARQMHVGDALRTLGTRDVLIVGDSCQSSPVDVPPSSAITCQLSVGQRVPVCGGTGVRSPSSL